MLMINAVAAMKLASHGMRAMYAVCS